MTEKLKVIFVVLIWNDFNNLDLSWSEVVVFNQL
jgi:hypothetical protein